MIFSATQFEEQLKALLPRGEFWKSLKEDLVFAGWLSGEAIEYSRIDVRLAQMIDETDPRTVIELIDEWESFAGLPDPCVGALSTLQQRRQALLNRLVNRGGQSRQFFIDLAKSIGVTITITEYIPFMAGIGRVGEKLLGEVERFSFTVNAPSEIAVFFRTGESTTGENLKEVGNTLLECVINNVKPAHVTVIFSYTL